MRVVQQQTAWLLRLFVLPRSGLLAFVALRGTAHVREALLPRHRTGASRIVCLAPARDRTSGSSFSGKLPKGHSSSSQHPRRFWRGFWCCLANEYVLYLQTWLGSSVVGSWAAPWGGLSIRYFPTTSGALSGTPASDAHCGTALCQVSGCVIPGWTSMHGSCHCSVLFAVADPARSSSELGWRLVRLAAPGPL